MNKIILGGLLICFLGLICLTIPLILTIFNIINLFKKNKIKENLIDTLTFTLGIVFTIILYIGIGFKDYNQTLKIGTTEMSMNVHAPIASWSMPTVIAIIFVGILSYFLIRNKKLDMPPLLIVLSMSGIFICSAYIIIFLIQMCNENLIINAKYGIPYLLLFPINYIICSISAVIEIFNKYKGMNIKPKEYDNKILNKCSKILYNINNWPILAVIFIVPIAIILICILVLFGQRPDEAIKAFLETSDWTLSTKVSPPSVSYDDHYLCTVSLKGHKKVVKPIRIGIRKGEKIIVNRQLCIANAFEDFIQEKVPRFHHFIRYIYDKYGYPLSKHINNAVQADITYILMKPLEWLFLISLYLFDKKPENRIAIQYTAKKL